MSVATLYAPDGRLTCEKLGLNHEVDIVDWKFVLELDRCSAERVDVDFGHQSSLPAYFRSIAEGYRQKRLILTWEGMEGGVKLTAKLPAALEPFSLEISMCGQWAGAEDGWNVRATLSAEPAAFERFAAELQAASK